MIVQRFRPYFSGQGVQVEELCRALARRGAEPTVVTAVAGSHPAEERMDGYSIHRLRCDLPGLPVGGIGSHLWSPVFALRVSAYLLAQSRAVDLIHVHAQTDALYAAWSFSRLRPIPLLFEMTLLGSDDPPTMRVSRNRFRALRYAMYRRCDGYVAISPALARSYHDAGLPAERLRVIPQGVDADRFAPAADRRRLRQDLGLPPDDPLLVFVGSLIERKGLDVLLAAWARVRAASPRAGLLLVGRDQFPENPEAQAYLAACLSKLPAEATRNLLRLGVQDAPERFLQAADVFVFPSRREGFGTAIIEAMACGLPCVVSDLPGISDFIFASPARGIADPAAGADGAVVPQEDPQALAEAVLELIAAPDRAAAIGSAARARVRTTFGFDTIARAYLDFYAELLQARRGGR
jgi:glycosyltransferase involved in cell wall biosynthesis